MNVKAAAALAACAAVFASSCASAPPSAPLTIELFDSPAKARPHPAAVAALPLPDLPGRDGAPAEARLAAGVGSQPGPARPSAALGTSAVQDSALDASLAGPVRPAMAATFALVPPPVPAAAALAPPVRKPQTAVTAPRQARPAPSPAGSSIPVLPRTSPGSPAGATRAPASSMPAATPSAAPPGASAGAATGSTSGSAPASEAGASGSAYGRLREIYARQGDTLQIGLDGVGFLFLGLPDAQSGGMSFKSKENRDNRTLFTFQALKLGTYDLDFLQQDNMAGKTSRETVRVHVVSDQDFNAATAGPQAPPGQTADAVGDPQFARKLAAFGSYPAAVAELLKGYKDGNPALNDQIAALYLKMGSYDAAEKYYSKNLNPESDLTPRAVVGLVNVAIAQDDQPALVSYLKQFLAVADPSAEEPLIRAVRMEKRHGETGIALDLAQEYVTRYPSGAWRDEADFLSAQLLEADSQFRDIARARQLYQAILDNHPESPFADAARQRVLYIERHFFDVR